ncbi:ABC transporter ATP-binding protein [Aureimonas endophytica]|uniref:ABC transporter ATP-binding protein n=1 Tax=Aureimonas endophytica TaxID=2027858 RepID=A0A917E8Q6_9HYPH|nr:ATP-binding cassette domain-containing protein [Aureimonas endophytica]GGE11745.1 ABC transporter ATP-binding protein [Aureimonas endophytica]
MPGPPARPWRSELARRPVGTLLATTLALNLLGLALPLAASQVFGRIVPNPQSATLPFLVAGVVGLGAVEAFLRYVRNVVLIRSGANFAGPLTHRLLSHVVASEPEEGGLSGARSVEHLAAIQHMKEKYNGQILVGLVELLFLPVIVGTLFLISWTAGAFVTLCLGVFAALTLKDALAMRRLVDRISADSEGRYDFLFAMLSGISAIKAMGVEDEILRRYEAHQGRIAEGSHELARITGRLLNSAPVASQILIAAMLALGAAAVAGGEATMAGVSALVLLSGRVMAPLQRAVFILVQMREIRTAEARVDKVLAQPAIATPIADLAVENTGAVAVSRLSCFEADGTRLFENVDFSLAPGEIAAVSGPSERANSMFLQLLAGIHRPTGGEVWLNGTPPTSYPTDLLNRCVAYVPAEGVLFRGTIRDNITRFGEVSVGEAMEVAGVLEIDQLLDELPNGLDTVLTGAAGEAIPPGLCQQIAILRALVLRPRLILLDNADRGLDRSGYAKLHRFIGKVHRQASFVIVSDDANLTGNAERKLVLGANRLRVVGSHRAEPRQAYRELTL